MKKAFLLSFFACGVGVVFSPQIVVVAKSLASAAEAEAHELPAGWDVRRPRQVVQVDHAAEIENLLAEPPAPEATQLPPAVQPIGPASAPLKEMLTIAIAGPTDGVRGDKAYFRATVTGSPDFVSWELSPPAAGLDVLEGGRAASFANRQPGVYVVRCTISGAAGHVSSTHEYEILADPEPPAIELPATAPAQNPAAMTGMMQQPQFQQQPQQFAAPQNAITWPGGIRLLAERVASNTRAAEGKIVAGSFRSVANRIKVGTFAGVDPWDEAYRQSREALGQAYTPWSKFFVDLGQLVGGLKQQGLVTNPQSSVLLLESAASALGDLP